ncbi:hypothetical protein AB0I54_21025 [Streptomyces sp. NPDC050625]|jgi:hypothetical protein|uniref:hypothetical protein n=1 Tax=Streptomyces sp. NPDC050625 TaxID=3154629 RepID=UPI00341AFF74
MPSIPAPAEDDPVVSAQGREFTDVITLTSKSTGISRVAVGSGDTSVGDQIIITADLFLDGLAYGTEAAVCTRVADDTTHCVGTFALPQGQLTWQHMQTTPVGTPPENFCVAITGGTGLYAAARGFARIAHTAQAGGDLTLYLSY